MMQTYSPDRHPTPISISVVCNTTDTNEMGNAADEVSVCESFISRATSPVSMQTSAIFSLTDYREPIEEIVSQTTWPGVWMKEQQDLAIDYETQQLYDIMESAKQVLDVDYKGTPKYKPWQRKNGDSLSKLTNPSRHNQKSLSLSLPSAAANDPEDDENLFKDRQLLKLKPVTSRGQRSAGLPVTRRIQTRQRPKTTEGSTANSRARAASNYKLLQNLPKYKPPTGKKVKREYRQLWNERGKIEKKDTTYLEIHYDDCLPAESDDEEKVKMTPKKFTHNHRHGFHWEVRHRADVQKAQPKVQKVERLWENEFQLFKLDSMLNKKLNL